MSAPTIIDDKSPHVIPFILTHLRTHHASPASQRPFIVALNGIQGIGKTTLVSAMVSALASSLQELEPSSTPTNTHTTTDSVLVLSLDDFYLTHADQQALYASNPTNTLLAQRGEPGTHDIPLLNATFDALLSNSPDIPVPSYDKSAFAGKGDRVPPASWRRVNREGGSRVRVVVLEGWMVGYRALSDLEVKQKFEAAPAASSSSPPSSINPETFSRLKAHPLEHLLSVNALLAPYEKVIADMADAFVHLDAESPTYAYTWRRQQEAALRAVRGEGNAMSEEEVGVFVDGYFPAYELYLEGVRRGVLRAKEGMGVEGRQLRLVCGSDRKVKEVVVI